MYVLVFWHAWLSWWSSENNYYTKKHHFSTGNMGFYIHIEQSYDSACVRAFEIIYWAVAYIEAVDERRKVFFLEVTHKIFPNWCVQGEREWWKEKGLALVMLICWAHVFVLSFTGFLFNRAELMAIVPSCHIHATHSSCSTISWVFACLESSVIWSSKRTNCWN